MKQGKIEFNGTEYTLQHPGALWFLDVTDMNRMQTGFIRRKDYYKELLDNVVVQPKLSIDDFEEDLKGLMEVVGKVETFLGGNNNESEAEGS